MRQNNGFHTFLFVAIVLGAAGLHDSAGRAEAAESVPQNADPYENELGMKFVMIPAGEFSMGTSSPDTRTVQRSFPGGGNENIFDETPQHQVRITKPLLLAVHEVTVGQFRTFVDATGYRTDAEGNGPKASGWNRNSRRFDRHEFYNWRNPGFDQDDDHPVVNVSWNDAQEFCRWLSRLEQRVYRLPTEAEWEYACRAGTTTWFSSGDAAEKLVSIGNVADRSARMYWGSAAGRWAFLNSDDRFLFSCPVGRFKPNAWGLYDMHGNVWEWCADRYDSSYYRVSPQDDPSGPAGGSERVCRGGSWGTYAQRCRAAYRNHGDADESQRFIGFRVARDPKGP